MAEMTVQSASVTYIIGEQGEVSGRVHIEGGRLVVGDTLVDEWLQRMLGGTPNFQGVLRVQVGHAFPTTTTATGDLGALESSEPVAARITAAQAEVGR